MQTLKASNSIYVLQNENTINNKYIITNNLFIR